MSATGSPPRKVDTLAALIRAGKWTQALAMAAKWPRLGDEEKAIKTAASAALAPELYRQMGREPQALIEEGKAALLRRYFGYLGEK